MEKHRKHCLLVVDDEADLVDSVKDLLRYEYRVLGATRAAEGLEIMKREKVHIVMSDQCMPEMSGVEFLSRLKEQYPDTVRLLFTAYADIKAVIDAINQGSVYRYITKPWEQEDLLMVLRQATDYYDLLAERNRLFKELQETNQQLKQANHELKQANELKKGFIKVASHELRTPLTIVMGLADLAHRQYHVEQPLKGWIDRIYVGSQRLNDRVDQMIKLLLADQFDKPLNCHQVSVSQILDAATADVQTFIRQRKQTLEVVYPDEPVFLMVEEDKIHDCLLQLLVNAVKFTPDGGTIRLSAKPISEQEMQIQVSDSGVGIDPASLARIFDPFFTKFDVSRHASGTFEFERRGLGLGLSVVKAFVEMHGGRVKVDSKINQGSTFTILLPATS